MCNEDVLPIVIIEIQPEFRIEDQVKLLLLNMDKTFECIIRILDCCLTDPLIR